MKELLALVTQASGQVKSTGWCIQVQVGEMVDEGGHATKA